MSIDNIVFEKEDTRTEMLKKTVLLFAGTNELKNELRRKGITKYSKVCKGTKTSYILRGQQIGRLVITL